MTLPPPRSWRWETPDAEWGVEIVPQKGILSWWGADKPRPGVPSHAQGGGGQFQTIADFLACGQGPYPCPPPIRDALRDALKTGP